MKSSLANHGRAFAPLVVARIELPHRVDELDRLLMQVVAIENVIHGRRSLRRRVRRVHLTICQIAANHVEHVVDDARAKAVQLGTQR